MGGTFATIRVRPPRHAAQSPSTVLVSPSSMSCQFWLARSASAPSPLLSWRSDRCVARNVQSRWTEVTFAAPPGSAALSCRS